MDLTTFCARLDDRLRTDAYADVDASANGLQVGPDEGTVDHAAFAVDAASATIETAIDRGADCLVVHHGLSWGGFDRLTGRDYERIAPLVREGVALYVSHLPLDGHQELGNAAGLADHLGLEKREPFGEYGGEYIGQRGRTDPVAPHDLADALSSLDTGGETVQHLEFGPDRIEEVAVVTGSGADWLAEAEAVGADALVTGEGKQQLYHEAREAGVHAFLAGHYATETFGVRALRDLVDSWGVETTFLDHPTGL
ncbi:Nif3-like dinuclear metal center hexameric protein [Halomarina litorea]|uniref:Nif3-like dinuclear metal center hexameric protein n=1 Tax=Halomarina litorea TaxID=2961595 RepID=UPI0020C4D6AD|nr:Nif3-like dinuclear metal center hexameric protein [Halomarina sp. BCD28]